MSLNRNIGLKYVQGKIVAFPDDDCEYKTSTLSDVLNHFEQDKALNILTINTFCKNNHCFFCDNIKIRLTPRNYYSRAISMGIFVRYINKDDLYFDENMGVGAYWGAGEESDFVSSLLSKSYIGLYNGMISIYHPQISVTKENLNQWIKRYRNYGLGYGALMKKEIVMRHKYYYITLFARDLLGRLFASALPIKKRKLYWVSFKYRLLGFLSYKIKFHAKSL